MQSLSRYENPTLTLSKEAIIRFLLYLTFCSLCTSFNQFNLGGRNLLLLFISTLSGIFILSFDLRRAPSNNTLGILAAYLSTSYILNVGSAKTTSFFYSLFFLFNYWFLFGYFKKYLTIKDYNTVLKFTFLLYFVGLIAGQLYLYLGFFPAELEPNSGVTHGAFGTLYETGRGSYRFYSLSTEPSYASFIVIILFYSILKTSPGDAFDKGKIMYWVMLIYMIFFFKSGYGMILISLLLLVHLKKVKHAIPVMVGVIAMVPIVLLYKTSAITRLSSIITDLDWTNIFSLSKIDYSASFRILPFFHYLNDINISDIHFYIGHGAGTSVGFLIPLLFNVPMKSYEGGFIPQFLYDYGIMLLPIFFLFLKWNVIAKILSFEMVIILFMMTNANFNTQLFWVTIICFALNRFYFTSPFLLKGR